MLEDYYLNPETTDRIHASWLGEPIERYVTWPPEQRLAVYDFCRLISESLWQQDPDGLLEVMIRDDRKRGFDYAYDLDNRNLDLPFDDDLF